MTLLTGERSTTVVVHRQMSDRVLQIRQRSPSLKPQCQGFELRQQFDDVLQTQVI